MTLPANISNLVSAIEQTAEKIDSGDAQFLKMQKEIFFPTLNGKKPPSVFYLIIWTIIQ